MMGYTSLHTYGNASHNAIVDSTRLWLGINGEIIILAFLPGLLFLDSYNINVFLFKRSFTQILTFAFPMVLGGTALTALVAYYLFPYGWGFNLSMTFGSILSATGMLCV
jgi:NhaP-type Na+/H+ or K+/H+ antiporter